MSGLTKQEKAWILGRHFRRLHDNQEVQIYPMGAERYLSLILTGQRTSALPIQAQIENKDILVIPGHGNAAFLFAEAKARAVTVYDLDPVTIAWLKGFKHYYHFRPASAAGVVFPSIGEILAALTAWYPPHLRLPENKFRQELYRFIHPNGLRRIYLHYLIHLLIQAVDQRVASQFELETDLSFQVGTIDSVQQFFDTGFVPYLLGVRNGVETEMAMVDFLKKILPLVRGMVMVTPTQSKPEFYFCGKRYFETTPHRTLKAISEVAPHFRAEETNWFRTQGLAFLSKQPAL